MTTTAEILAVQIGFRRSTEATEAARWEAAIQALLAWDPRLAPQHVQQLSGPGPDLDEAWSAPRMGELAKLLAGPSRFSWMMNRDDEERVGFTVSGSPIDASVRLTTRWPAASPREHFTALIRSLSSVMPPALAFAYDQDTADQACTLEGMKKLTRLPPLLFLDGKALERGGGAEKWRGAPCQNEALSDGLLLVLRAEMAGEPGSAERDTIASVARHLGIGPKTPLVLAP